MKGESPPGETGRRTFPKSGTAASIAPPGGYTEARAFLEALDPHATEFTFQVFDDKDDGNSPAGWRHGALAQHYAWLQQKQRQGGGAFVMINGGDGKGRSKPNVVRVRAVFVDFDGAPLPTDWPLQPHIVVASSPGRYHAYFRVQDVPLEAFRGVQEFLATRYGGCGNVKDLPRVMRLPGFLHQKGEPYPTRLLETHDHDAFTLAELRAAFPGLEDALRPPAPKKRSVTLRGSGFRSASRMEAYGQAAARGTSNGNRHGTFVSLSMKCRATGLTEAEANAVIEGAHDSLPDQDGFPLSEALGTVAWAYSQEPDGSVAPLEDRPQTISVAGGNRRLKRWLRLMGRAS